jgi:membrane associated rhomboid family serine protease
VNNNKILWGSEKNAIITLIAINLSIYLFFLVMYMIFGNDLDNQAKDYNSVVGQFALPASNYVQKPWTLFTYFFTQVGLLTLLSNMIWLFSFAYLLQQLAGNRYLIPSYLYGGIAGGVVFIIVNTIFPGHNRDLMSPTMAILSVAATTVAFAPNYKIFPFINGGISLWIIFVAFLFVDFLGLAFQNKYLLPSHIAAAAIGYFYGKSAINGNDFGNWMHWIYNEFLGNKTTKKAFNKSDVYYKTNVVPFNRQMKVNQITVDEILDKINVEGIDSLNAEEKNILKKAKDTLL